MESEEDGIRGAHERTVEEEDSILRSMKKPKGETMADENMDDEIDKLIRLNGGGNISESEEDDWKEIQRREEEEDGGEKDPIQGAEDDPLCPSLQFSKSQRKEDCRQWRKALIIKLLGKRIGARFLMARLQRLWNLVSTYELIDLDNGHLILRFQDEGDYLHVLQEGPWIVADHYVVVQRWRPFFDPYDEGFKKLAIGNLFGRTLIVDKNFLRRTELGDDVITERAKFARICVEVDLRRSFLSKFKIREKVYQVGYEGLHLIFFRCGIYGHRKDQCVDNQLRDQGKQMGADSGSQRPMEGKAVEIAREKGKKEEAFGSWMVIQRIKIGGKAKAVPMKKVVGVEECAGVDKVKQVTGKVDTTMEEASTSVPNVTMADIKEEANMAKKPIDESSREAEIKEGNIAVKGGIPEISSPCHSLKVNRLDSGRQKKGVLKESRGKNISSGVKNSKGVPYGHKKGEMENLPPNALVGGPDSGSKQRSKIKDLSVGSGSPVDESNQVKIKGKGVVLTAVSNEVIMGLKEQFPSVNKVMFICSWNCKGVGEKEFPALVRDMRYRFNFSILALLETKISGNRGDMLIKKLGFSRNFKKYVVGFSMGIWLLWDEKKVKVEIIDAHHQFIHTKVIYLEKMKSEYITFVYGSPRRLERQSLWLSLESIAQEIVGPWLVLGDFNSILNASEKIGGKEVNESSLIDMQRCLTSCDIGFKGPGFTWKRGKLQERLDRACSNEAWNLSWPNSILSHLPYFNYDHRLILLIQDQVNRLDDKDKPFRFLAS
ncbi:uncharacterized protein LOC133294125 [Gastrolobium bilobum]|uniref:uncharacterized protein LOC133294125 n=1 Tax=Gastrolobium bilobum TaxID=150636 RepID=UPI002AB09F6F|nr:uncharacterized protein LOC133294125 [Gastrolobium bilobum]